MEAQAHPGGGVVLGFAGRSPAFGIGVFSEYPTLMVLSERP